MQKRSIDLTVDGEVVDVLTPQQRLAVSLILQGKMLKDVAKEVGVHPNTMTRWRKQDDFVQAIKEGELEGLKAAQKYINSKTLDAAKELWAIAQDKSNASKVRADIYAQFLNWGISPKKKLTIEAEEQNNSDLDISAAIIEAQKQWKKEKESA